MIRTALYLFIIISISACRAENADKIELDKRAPAVTLFGEDVISTDLYERDIAITQDGKTIVWSLGNHKQTFRCLVAIHKSGNQWGEKEILPFSGQYQDIEPFFSHDGEKLFFASNRPMGTDTTRSDYNLWVVNRQGETWTIPQPLDTIINGMGDEYYPSVSANGNLYFTATRKDGIGKEDIFRSDWLNGKFIMPQVLDTSINTLSYEFNAFINPEENVLVFGSYGRKDGMGGGDLYVSKKNKEGLWSASRNLGPKINTKSLDYCPFIDYARGHFYFTSEQSGEEKYNLQSIGQLHEAAYNPLNGFGNIYRIDLDQLDF